MVVLRVNGSALTAGTISNGIFSYNTFCDTVAEATLEVRSRTKATYTSFFLEPGTIRILDEGMRISAYGTELNNRFAALEASWDSSARAGGHVTGLQAANWKRSKVANLVEKEPSSLLSLRMLYRYFYLDPAADDTLYYRLFQLLEPGLKHTTQGKKMYEEVKGRYAVALGRKATALSLPDAQNNLRPLYQQGSYTLLHFWASWCQPCRKENNLLRKIFRDYAGLGLVITGVSMDEDRSAWAKAVKSEKLEWTQVSDLQAWKSPVAEAYNIIAIPSNFLIGPDGTILAKNVGPDDIKKYLAVEEAKN